MKTEELHVVKDNSIDTYLFENCQLIYSNKNLNEYNFDYVVEF